MKEIFKALIRNNNKTYDFISLYFIYLKKNKLFYYLFFINNFIKLCNICEILLFKKE